MTTKLEIVSTLSALKPNSTFLQLHNYRSKTGELANHQICFHISYQKALEKSIAKLEQMEVSDALQIQAKAELISSFLTSLEKMLSTDIEDLQDGFVRFFDDNGNYIKGIKLCESTGNLHIYGLTVNKKIIEPAKVTEDKRRPLTRVKDSLRYQTPVGKFRNYIVAPECVERISVASLSILPPNQL